MKKYAVLTICLLLLSTVVICAFSDNDISASSPIIAQDGEIIAYAAAFATLDTNKDKNKSEMISYSKEYLSKRTDILLTASDYLKENSVSLSNANYIYSDTLLDMNKVNMTAREYDSMIPEGAKQIIEERNTFLEKIDRQLYVLDEEYQIENLPVLYYSIDELKIGLEESLKILNDYDQMMDGKSEPDMDGYTIDDFYRLLNDRINIEQAILNELNNDPEPDLYSYCLKLYNAREAYPVIY